MPSWNLIPKNMDRWNSNSIFLGMFPQPSPLNPQAILSIEAFKEWLTPHGKGGERL